MWQGTLRALVALVFAGLCSGFAPAPDEAALEYSKQLYAEGEAAMQAGKYEDAFIKFQTGYRYAPDLHIFTYNIASAADAAGNCSAAQTWFQRFLDLVPKHPERETAKKRLEELKTQCEPLGVLQPTFEVQQPVASPDRKSRSEVEAERAFNDAFFELVRAMVIYRTHFNRHKQTRVLVRAARRKKLQAKRMRKLLVSHGVEVDEFEAPKAEAATTIKDACREARAEENKVKAALDAVLEWYDTKEAYRVVRRFTWFSERIDLPRFEECT